LLYWVIDSPIGITARSQKSSFEPYFAQSRLLHRFSVPLLPKPRRQGGGNGIGFATSQWRALKSATFKA
jgi:hypothetical protein